MKLSFDDEESFKDTAGSLRFNNPPSNPDTPAFQGVGSSSSMPHQEMDEDICFNNPPSDPNAVGSTSLSMPSEERFEIT